MIPHKRGVKFTNDVMNGVKGSWPLDINDGQLIAIGLEDPNQSIGERTACPWRDSENDNIYHWQL